MDTFPASLRRVLRTTGLRLMYRAERGAEKVSPFSPRGSKGLGFSHFYHFFLSIWIFSECSAQSMGFSLFASFKISISLCFTSNFRLALFFPSADIWRYTHAISNILHDLLLMLFLVYLLTSGKCRMQKYLRYAV